MPVGKTITFSGKGQPGNLLDPKNWAGGTVPGIDNTALITTNVGGPVSGVFSVNNLMLLGAETITFTGTLDAAGVGACQGLMVCDGATAIFAAGARLNDGNVLIVGNDAVGSLLALGAGATQSSLSSVDANLGKQDAGVGTVTIDDGVWTNSGHAFIGDDGAGTLTVIDDGVARFGGDVDMAADAGSSGKLTVGGGGSVVVAGTLRAGGALAASSGIAAVRVTSGGTLTVDTTLAVGTGSTLTLAAGTVTAGTIRVLAGGVVSGSGTLSAPVVQDEGSIVASGGNLRLDGEVNGTGTIQIAANSTATLSGDSLRLAGIAFMGPDATLVLAHGSSVTAAISGFAIGDVIGMANIDAVSFNAATGRLTLSDHDAPVETLRLVGNFSGDGFTLQQTAAGAMIGLRQLASPTAAG